jgi:hypothetical protein
MTYSRYIPIIAIVVLLGVSSLGAYSWHKQKIQTAIAEHDRKLSEYYNSKILSLMKEKEQTEQKLLQEVKNTERKKNEEISRVTRRYDDIIAGLRNRPDNRQTGENYTNSAAETPTETGATGLQLSRPDAEFLARFARDTAELQAELKACIRDYESVREIVNNFGE